MLRLAVRRTLSTAAKDAAAKAAPAAGQVKKPSKTKFPEVTLGKPEEGKDDLKKKHKHKHQTKW